jgi:hypothetical protein
MENTTQPTQITIADLDQIKNIIDLATSRGAFRANELTQIGSVYDRLVAFLAAIVEQAQAQEASSGSAGAPADTTDSQGE